MSSIIDNISSSNNAFALETFKSNPLVAIQHDGDLSKIEDNTRLNSLVSHELMTVNEKHKSLYSSRFKSFLFMGTNKPVKITDAKSGLIRRLIDVRPSGNRLSQEDYDNAVRQISFELGAIASHCLQVYNSSKDYYNAYTPVNMMGATNDFYNFVTDSYYIFSKDDCTSLKVAWEMYKTYCDEAKVSYPYSQRLFKEELKNYFREYKERYIMEDGTRVRNYYSGFRTDKLEERQRNDSPPKEDISWLNFSETVSLFDKAYADCPAQYANDYDIPTQKWDLVTTKLSDLDTTKLHYVKTPETHIFIDFDIPDESGNKSFEKNFAEASKWKPTYAELSKSGQGIHLHDIYDGDVSKLSRIYNDHIEIKVLKGNSSLRRKLTKCNNLPIAHISSGLPLKGETKMVNFETIKSEKSVENAYQKKSQQRNSPCHKTKYRFHLQNP